MPRVSNIAQADIARTLRAFRGLGIDAEVRIYPDGMVIICEKGKDFERPVKAKFDNGEEIRL